MALRVSLCNKKELTRRYTEKHRGTQSKKRSKDSCYFITLHNADVYHKNTFFCDIICYHFIPFFSLFVIMQLSNDNIVNYFELSFFLFKQNIYSNRFDKQINVYKSYKNKIYII